MADKSTTIISLPQMVDLALNSPEVGIVNFTVLHSLLHVIVNQLDMGDCNVEFRGSDSERLQNYISTAKPGPIITLTEYTVGPDGKGRKKKSKKGGSKRSSVVSDEKGKKDEKQKEKEIAIIKKEDESGNASASSGSLQTIVVVEPASKEKIGDSPKFTIALTKEQLSKLQKDIKDLQKQVTELTEMPGNLGLIDAIKSNKEGSNSPLLDMFQILTLVKRLDATEAAMNKMASMIEDLAKAQSSIADETPKGGADDKTEADVIPKDKKLSFKEQSKELVSKSQELRKSLDGTVGGRGKIEDLSNELKELEKRVNELEKRPTTDSRASRTSLQKQDSKDSATKSKTSSPKQSHEETKQSGTEKNQPKDGGDTDVIDLNSTDLTTLPPKEAIAELQKAILAMKDQANQAGLEVLKEVEQLKKTLVSDDNEINLPPDVKLGQMDIKINDLKDQLSTLDTVYNQQFIKINSAMDHLEQEIASVWERIKAGLPAGDAPSGTSNQTIQELYNKLTQLKDDMNGLSEIANKLLSEREGRQKGLDVMIEQIELLKTVKADREDLEDALADKADACQVNRKVSHEQFDAAYDEITKSLDNTLAKLKEQEDLWTQSLNDLQKEIGNKLDKMELTPLKDFINSKLKAIQDKVKKISQMRQEHEAAGTKSKLLRNVNCISCDSDVVMKMQTDITMFPKPYASPPSKSPGPYLAYELDLLRKQQKTWSAGKNMNIFEFAMQSAKMKTPDKDHLCNRYCGGSHTVTTPEQRVMRVGHFMEQWGPEIAPVNDLLIKGTDGHYYKGRNDAALKAAAMDRPPTPKVEVPAFTVSPYEGANKTTSPKDSKEVSKRGSKIVSPKEGNKDVSDVKNKEADNGDASKKLNDKDDVSKMDNGKGDASKADVSKDDASKKDVGKNDSKQEVALNSTNNKAPSITKVEPKGSQDIKDNIKRPKTSVLETGKNGENNKRASTRSAEVKPN